MVASTYLVFRLCEIDQGFFLEKMRCEKKLEKYIEHLLNRKSVAFFVTEF